MNRSPVISLLLLLGLAIVATACGPTAPTSSQVAAQRTPRATADKEAMPVMIDKVERGNIAYVFSYPGHLQPKDEIEIIPAVAGHIESVLVEEEDVVKTGDAIAIIEDDTYQAQVKQAEAAVEQARLLLAEMVLGSRPEEITAARTAVELAKANLNDVATVDDDERTQAAANLAQTEAALRQAQTEYDKIAWAGSIGSEPQALILQEATIAYENALASYNKQTNPGDSQLAPLRQQVAQAELNLALTLRPYRQIDFAKAQAGLKQAEAALEVAQLQLDKTIIKAPFDGTIDQLHIANGSWVSQQTSIGAFISEALEAKFEVQESRIAHIERGQYAGLQLPAYPGRDFPGVITNISASANDESRTFEIKVTLAEGVELLRPGMFVDVSILADESNDTLLTPLEAVVPGDPPSVFVVNEDNRIDQRSVTTGLQDDHRIEILQGLQAGDWVVIAGQDTLEDGTPVQIINDPRIAD